MPFIDYTNTKFEIGQTVALNYENNKLKYSSKNETYVLSEISKIGKKYLTLTNGIKIDLFSGFEKTNTSPNYQMFESENDLLDYYEREKNIIRIKSEFSGYTICNLTNDQINRIVNIIKEKDNV